MPASRRACASPKASQIVAQDSWSSPAAFPAAWFCRAAPGPTITIRYRNFRGQDLTFTADAASARQKKNHLSIKAVPTGQRVTLARARIQNWRAFEDSLSQRVAPGQEWPTPRERQVLAYHKKYGTTSPLYEEIRAKYPDW